MNALTFRRNVLRKFLTAVAASLICHSALVGSAQTTEQPAKPLPKIVRKVPLPAKTTPTSQPPAAGRGPTTPVNGNAPQSLRPLPRRRPRAEARQRLQA
jgi:hypothetical protein